MNNPLSKHYRVQGMTYYQHWVMAFASALLMIVAGLFLLIHSFLPFVPIPGMLCLTKVIARLKKHQNEIESCHWKYLARESDYGKYPNRNPHIYSTELANDESKNKTAIPEEKE